MHETWAATAEFPDHYEASSLGNIRRKSTQRALKPWPDSYGYLRLELSVSGKKHRRSVHRLVCSAFHGAPTAALPWVNHIDGNPQNNSAGNLEWTTPRLNAIHAFNVLMKPKSPEGERHYCAKLTENDVREIRRLKISGETYTSLGRTFGVDRNTIKQIFTGRSWTHIS